VYKVEPIEAVLACNLLAKDCWRAALADEMVERWPKVPLVSKPASFACRAERLTGAGAGPDGAVVWPSSQSKSVGPHANSGKEVALGIRLEVIWGHILDAAFVYVTWRDMPGCNQVPQPLGCVGFDLVIVGRHSSWLSIYHRR
jgi:hypothetical protein